MKKILLALLSLLWLIPLAEAVPAYPGTYPYKQPDGTVIILQNHGDEYYHWITDASGRIVEKGADGFYHPVDPAVAARRARAARAQAQARRAARAPLHNPPVTNFGDRKILCILAEFQPEPDEDFNGRFVIENPQEHFSNMLNQAGYDEDGAYGSVRDYYLENSGNQYRPQFDVYGPVLLDNPSSYYDQKGAHLAILEAYDKMASQIPIADYDTDGDGNLDMVLFYYPGHNEAEGAPEWTIWPHQSTSYFGVMGGKGLVRYFCTSELRGNSGQNVAAIGTTCHEFAHSLGLPDFYDTDYADNGENGFTTGSFDLMASGNYNDNGRMPPYLNALERNMLGWMDAPQTIGSTGSYTLQGVQYNQAYRIDGRTSGEYFLLECRDGKGWDGSFRFGGLAIYHVDQSGNVVPGSGQTAAYLWDYTNDINSYGGHPCFYLLSTIDNPVYINDYLFPGRAPQVTSVALTDWSGETAGLVLNNIAFRNDQVTFGADLSIRRMLSGRVTDNTGNPVEGATVALSQSAYAFAAPATLSTDQVCETDADGRYSFSLADDASEFQVVSVRKAGFVPQACNRLISGIFSQQDFVMLALGQDYPASLKKYSETELWMGSITGFEDMAAGFKYTAEELAEMGAIGATITDVTFMLGAEQGETIYVIVDIGGDRKLIQVASGYVADQYVTVDISSQNLVIPAGVDVYIGAGMAGIQTQYPFRYFLVDATNGGNYVLPDFLNGHYSWGVVNFSQPASFVVSANLARVAAVDFAAYGVSYIKLVDNVPQVVPAAGKTVYEIAWSLDGTPINGTPGDVRTLPAGPHTYMARLTYYDGTAERVYFDVKAD